MKPKYRNLLLSLGTALIATSTAQAQLTWDANGNTANQTDGAGSWNTATELRWWNGATNVDWTSGSNAIFGNGAAGGAVTLASPTTVGSLKFNYFTGTYTLGTAANALTINNGINKTAGSGIVNFASNITLGAAQTWTNNSATNLLNTTGLRTLDNGGHNLTLDGTGNFSFVTSAGNTLTITGAGGLIKNGTGHVTMDSNPNVAHNFTGDIVINGGSLGFQTTTVLAGKNTTLNGGYIGGRTGSGFTWTGGLGTGANQIQITGGTSGFSGEGSGVSTYQIGSALSTLTWGTASFNPAVLLLNGDARMNTNGKGSLNNAIDLNGTTRTITSLHNTDGAAGSGFTVNGAISNGTGTAGLTKTGLGNLILIAANTYNGATTITSDRLNGGTNGGGSITLSGAGTINNTSALNLNGTGTLRLVNTAQVNRFADSAAITSNGGTISYENTSGANVYTETLGSLGLVSGQTNIVLNTNQAGAGSQTLTLGGLTRTGTNTSAVSFSANTTGPQITGNKNMIVVSGSGTTTAGQIIGAWASTGTAAASQTDYAVYDGNYVRGANITANNVETTWGSGANINLGVGTALTATRTLNTLRYSGAVDTLALGANNLETSGLLNGGTGILSLSSSGGALTTASGGGTLYVTTGSNGITSAAAITNNGSDAVNLVKSGTGGSSAAFGGPIGTLNGALVLNGVNTYTGDTTINAGVLQIGSNSTANGAVLGNGNYGGKIFIGSGASLYVQSNANQILSGVISGDGNLLKSYSGTLTLTGANTYTGRTIFAGTNATGGGASAGILSVASFNSVVGGTASSSLGAPVTVANGTITFGGGIQNSAQITYTGSGETTDRVIDFYMNGTGMRTIDASGTANSLLKFTSTATNTTASANSQITLTGTSNGEFVGGLAFGFSNLIKSGTGTWTLGGAVGSTGVLTVNAGTLALQQKSSVMGGNMANWTAAKINVKNGATLALNVDSADTSGLSSASLDTLLTNISAGVTTVNLGLQGGSRIGLDTSTATGGTFTQGNAIADSTGSGGFNGAIGLTKLGTGTLVLDKTNSYTGTTLVNAGKLVVNGNITTSVLTTVASGATIGGSGFTGALTVLAGGKITPGNSPGIFNVNGDYTQLGLYEAEIEGIVAGNGAGFHDQINVTGEVDITGGSLVTMFSGTGYAEGDLIFILLNDGTDAITGIYNGLVQWATVATHDNLNWVISYNANYVDSPSNSFNGGNDIALMAVAIPEPSSAVLLGALGTLALLRRRR